MYISERWTSTGVPGLLIRPGGAYLYRRRVVGRLHYLYLGRISMFDAEEIAAVLAIVHPKKWRRAVLYTKNFLAWLDTAI